MDIGTVHLKRKHTPIHGIVTTYGIDLNLTIENMKPDFKKWYEERIKDYPIGIRHTDSEIKTINQFAEDYAEKKAEKANFLIETCKGLLDELNGMKTFKIRWPEITQMLFEIDEYQKFKDES